MQAQPKVSIIVPVYNVQDYLEECLDAVLGQTLQDIEVIALDDGSTDGSLAILERYASQDERLRVIAKQNEGYGATVNRGFAEAKADYVGLIESDDWPEPTMFEKLYALAEKHGCDMVKCDFFDTYEQDEHPRRNLDGLPFGRPFDPVDHPQVMLITQSTWAALYRTSFLEQHAIAHRETPGAAFQDTAFSLKCLFAARNVALVRQPLLHYRRDASGSSMQTTDKLYTVADEFDEARRFFDSDAERRKVLLPWMRLHEWHNYRWEYERIAPEGRVAFMGRVQQQMCDAWAEGEVDLGIFPEHESFRLRLLKNVGAERFCAMFPEGFYGRFVLHEDMPAAPEGFLVSIVIPAYNDADYIERAVASCLRQTHEALEVICVDDCSSDSTLAKLRELAVQDRRIRVVALDPNSGEHNARAAGVAEAGGHILLFLDADDELKATACETAVRAYLDCPYDIMQFSDEVASDGRISAHKVREMTQWMRPRDGWLVGNEIVDLCFDEHTYSHSAHSKAFRCQLVKDSFGQLGPYRAESGVDALEYFAIALNSLVYHGVPSACCYVYHLGAGMSSREGMTYGEFARAIEGERAVEGFKTFLQSRGCFDEYQRIYESHKTGQTSFLVRTWYEDVRDEDKLRCLSEMVERWGLQNIVDAACPLGSDAVAWIREQQGGRLELSPSQLQQCAYADGHLAASAEYENSTNYRLGRALTALPRAARAFLSGRLSR